IIEAFCSCWSFSCRQRCTDRIVNGPEERRQLNHRARLSARAPQGQQLGRPPPFREVLRSPLDRAGICRVQEGLLVRVWGAEEAKYLLRRTPPTIISTGLIGIVRPVMLNI